MSTSRTFAMIHEGNNSQLRAKNSKSNIKYANTSLKTDRYYISIASIRGLHWKLSPQENNCRLRQRRDLQRFSKKTNKLKIQRSFLRVVICFELCINYMLRVL